MAQGAKKSGGQWRKTSQKPLRDHWRAMFPTSGWRDSTKVRRAAREKRLPRSTGSVRSWFSREPKILSLPGERDAAKWRTFGPLARTTVGARNAMRSRERNEHQSQDGVEGAALGLASRLSPRLAGWACDHAGPGGGPMLYGGVPAAAARVRQTRAASSPAPPPATARATAPGPPHCAVWR
jgi:hypothetical protein